MLVVVVEVVLMEVRLHVSGCRGGGFCRGLSSLCLSGDGWLNVLMVVVILEENIHTV